MLRGIDTLNRQAARKILSKKGESESDLRKLAIDVLKSRRCRVDEATIKIVVNRLRERKEESLRRKEKFLKRKKSGKIKLNFTKAEVEQLEQKEPLIPLNLGATDITPPDTGGTCEMQIAFVTDWFLEIWERIEARDKKASKEARAELQTFLLNSVGQLLRVALDDRDSIARQWACKLLADVFFSIGKHVGKVKIDKPYRKLMNNADFLKEKNRIGTVYANLLFPGIVRAITQCELKKAGRCRRNLLKDSKEAALKEKIPKSYKTAQELPEFKEKHLPQWMEFLWPLIQEKIDPSKLPLLAQQDPDKGGTRIRARYRSDSWNTAYSHLKALAKLRDKGDFYFF